MRWTWCGLVNVNCRVIGPRTDSPPSTLILASAGLAAIVAYKLIFTGFDGHAGLGGLGLHLLHEWVILTNLGLLLTGFAILSRHFEQSNLARLSIEPDTVNFCRKDRRHAVVKFSYQFVRRRGDDRARRNYLAVDGSSYPIYRQMPPQLHSSIENRKVSSLFLNASTRRSRLEVSGIVAIEMNH